MLYIHIYKCFLNEDRVIFPINTHIGGKPKMMINSFMTNWAFHLKNLYKKFNLWDDFKNSCMQYKLWDDVMSSSHTAAIKLVNIELLIDNVNQHMTQTMTTVTMLYQHLFWLSGDL